MTEIPYHGLEKLSDIPRTIPNMKELFNSMAAVIMREISDYTEDESGGLADSLLRTSFASCLFILLRITKRR